MRRNAGRKETPFLKRGVVAVLLLAFILEPFSVVFAQESGADPAPDSSIPSAPTSDPVPPTGDAIDAPTDTSTPTDTPDTPPSDTPTDTPPPTDDETPTDETPAIDSSLMAAAADSTNIPNSPREVLQSVRNGISSMVDTQTGALKYKYKIAVPPGRNQITTPDVNLSYNSADTGIESPVGAGWSIDIPGTDAEQDAAIGSVVVFGLGLLTPSGRLGAIPDSALVVRGGGLANQVESSFAKNMAKSAAQGVDGFSVQCSGSCDNIEQLGQYLPNTNISAVTAGDVRAAGGNVMPTPGRGYHATVIGLSPAQASQLPWTQYVNPNPLQ